jgi:hypothetical protein
MDEREDHPIKVLVIAPLIMVSLPTVSSFFSTRGCFLRGGWSPTGDPPPISLACGWPPGANDSLFLCWRRLGAFRVEDPSGTRKAGPNQPPEWAGPTGLGPPRPGRSPLSLPWVLMHLCTLPPTLAWFWRCYPRVQDGDSLCMKSGLLRFNPRGCSFVTLRSLPPLEVISSSSWTRTRLRKCSFELVANLSFMSMFSYINTTLPNACT